MEWRVVASHPAYEVSEDGRLRKGSKEIKPKLDRYGYVHVAVWKEGKRSMKYMHRLVAEAWLGASKGRSVNHIDGNKLNNTISNLEYVTRAENNRHAMEHGLNRLHGEDNPMAILTRAEVEKMRLYRKAGLSMKAIGERFGVSPKTVQSVVSGRTWRQEKSE